MKRWLDAQLSAVNELREESETDESGGVLFADDLLRLVREAADRMRAILHPGI
jgi:hypothetical protein